MVSILLEYPWEPLNVACFSDLHLDAPDHEAELLDRDLEEAAELGARFFVGGDIWSLILPGDRKRYSGQHGKGEYDALVDIAVEMAYERLKPYADFIDLIGVGNHESSVARFHYTDPINRLIDALEAKRDPKLGGIQHAGYSGFIRLRFVHTNQSGKTKGHRSRVYTDTWFYHHGTGGNAIVTRGAIDFQRLRAEVRADTYWLGHRHTNPSDIPRVKTVDQEGNILSIPVLEFYTAGYQGRIDNTRNYRKKGYVVDWAEEKFYGTPAAGNAIVSYIPSKNNKHLARRVGRSRNTVEKRLIKRV